MLFNSFSFAVFLPVVFTLYWASPQRFRMLILLISSYYFYMSWNIKYVTLILFTTAVSYFAAIALEEADNLRQKRRILTASLVLCMGVLFLFKYFNFFFQSLSDVLQVFSIPFHPLTLKLLLPVGISFYTFQTVGYVIDAYRGDIRAERDFVAYAAFVSFFPQLVAGPIERTKNLLPQIKAERPFDGDKALYGLKLILWGYFKKIIIADHCAIYAQSVYEAPAEYVGAVLALATFFFTIQIYCDFSGYSDIARGVAKLFNIDLMRNFNSPYFSASVREFWSRWHISLSTWFRDYVYIPLGGNRVSKSRRYCNLLIAFLASGLWHGANWTFLAWGGVHALAQIAEYAFNVKAPKTTGARRALRVCLIFSFVALAWVFFFSQSMSDALHVFLHMFDGISNPLDYARQGFVNVGFSWRKLAKFCALYLLPLGVADYWGWKHDADAIGLIESGNAAFRWVAYVTLGLMILFLSEKGVATEFIYFQF